MKTTLHLCCIYMLFLLTSCGSKTATDESGRISPDIVTNPTTASGNTEKPLPKFDFKETTFDFGSIKSGDVVTHEFVFTNTGDVDLVIAQANGSCGCTVPEFPKDPIAPGKDGRIKVTFNSEGMGGQLTKTVTLLANTIPATKVLTISAEVLKK